MYIKVSNVHTFKILIKQLNFNSYITFTARVQKLLYLLYKIIIFKNIYVVVSPSNVKDKNIYSAYNINSFSLLEAI